jgi:long-subunit fatty acid transport protein
MMDFYQDDIDNVYTQYPGDFDSYELHDQINTSFSGFGLKVGAMFHLTKDLRAGITVDLPRKLTVHETYATTDVIFFDDGFASEEELGAGEWEYVIKYPYKFSGGASLDMGPFTFAGSFDYRDWTQTEFDIPDDQMLSSDYQSLLDDNRFFAQDFRPTFGYAAGGEFRLPGTGIALRAGYRLKPSPIISANETLDREYISAGLGYNIDGGTVFNFGYTLGSWKRYSYDSYTPSGTSESIKSERFMAGITFQIN